MTALKLEVSNQHLLHSKLLAALRAARYAASLDEAREMLERCCTAPFWKVTNGGHHVALNYVHGTGTTVRVAMIAETSDPDETFKYADVRSEMGRIEERARGRDKFLRDAPAGSSNLRAAMLEEAIQAIAVQVNSNYPCKVNGVHAVTTGMTSAVDAALAIVAHR